MCPMLEWFSEASNYLCDRECPLVPRLVVASEGNPDLLVQRAREEWRRVARIDHEIRIAEPDQTAQLSLMVGQTRHTTLSGVGALTGSCRIVQRRGRPAAARAAG